MNASVGRFARHYLEMAVAMFAGMAVLYVPAVVALGALGLSRSELYDDLPTLALLGMAVAMTIPMVAWMRHRGHAWRPCAEMTASMLIPTLGVLILLWTGASDDFHGLMTVEHMAMGPAMLLAMLLRYSEYAGSHAAHGSSPPHAGDLAATSPNRHRTAPANVRRLRRRSGGLPAAGTARGGPAAQS